MTKACSHEGCGVCQIEGCGISHPPVWTPTVVVSINGHVFGGDDPADCVAHYLLSLGYPRDRPEHLRKVAEGWAARRPGLR